ncbi:RHS repeat domain-containing protein [Aeromonas jandaei]|uniref:RHS repeat domain-containing protein n=1 Tax=Aeromonas jandaei TaxID=650 RepID=UPI001ABF6B53|nr:RHS repeat protein [Aeromonas jandaei]QSR71972.1 RHS repeat protein [Aeromonas jandaei]
MTDIDEIYSAAFNYSNWFSTGVDSRTGVYNFTIQLAKIIWSEEETFTLSLTYNPYSTFDTGFGRGWQMNLAGYDSQTRRLLLASGQSYISTSNNFPTGDVTHQFRYLKLRDVKVISNSGMLTVIHKDGTCEQMGKDGAISELMAPSGHKLRFNYANGQLASIVDSMGKTLEITRQNRQVIVTSTNKQSRVVVDYNSANLVNTVSFPDGTVASVGYRNVAGCDVINRVSLPTGGWEEIEYDEDIMLLPSSGSPFKSLPAVTRHIITGAGLIPIETLYSYTTPHNYLGGGTSASYRDGYDSLFDASENYTYGCTITQQLVETEITYNKYHLEINKIVRDLAKSSRPVVYRQATTFYAIPSLPFEQQPAQYNLPRQVEEEFINGSQSRKQVIHSEYDNYGNMTTETDAYGVRKVYSYYSASGETGRAPASLSGYPYLVKEMQTHPSVKYLAAHDKVMFSLYQYQDHPAITGSSRYPVLIKEESRLDSANGTLLNSIFYTYCVRTSPMQPEIHGRVETIRTVFGSSGEPAAIQSERYTYTSEPSGVRRVKTTERYGVPNTTESELLCKHTGLSLETIDMLGVKTTQQYDALGRISQQVERVGSSNYELTSTFNYVNSSQGRTLSVERTDGNNSKMEYDALGRTKKLWEVHTGNTLVPIWEVNYNGMGQQATKKMWMEDGNGQIKELAMTYVYDVWGEVYAEVQPSGVKKITERDKVVNCIREYNESRLGDRSDAVVTTYDELDNEIGKSTPFGASSTHYDGHGRQYKTVDPSGNMLLSVLDGLGRIIRTESNTTPKAVVEKEYDLNSPEEWATLIRVDGVEVGHRMYDRLGRITEESKGRYKTKYEYNTLSEKPSKVIQPDGRYVNYNIDPTLNEVISFSGSAGESAIFGFAKKSGLPEMANNPHFTLSKSYFPNGMVQSEKHSGRVASYSYTRQGKLLSVEDYFSRRENRVYDAVGRLVSVIHSNGKIEFTYDEFDRVRTETVVATGTPNVEHSYVYDTLHRIQEKRSKVNNIEQLVQQYTYDNQDRVASRKLLNVAKEPTLETYEYSVLGQLKKMIASGPLSPRFQGTWPIRQQEFEFDLRGNITKVKTTFDAGGQTAVDEAIYSNDTDNRLNAISHTYPGLNDVTLEYDNCGNLKKDQEGRFYTYNTLGQLVSVIDNKGNLISEYRYGADGIQRQQVLSGQPAMEFYYSLGVRLNESQADSHSRTYIVNDKPLGREVRHQNQTLATLFIGDYKNSVLVEVDNQSSRSIVYTPYGETCELA